jgi:hypothetical protein
MARTSRNLVPGVGGREKFSLGVTTEVSLSLDLGLTGPRLIAERFHLLLASQVRNFKNNEYCGQAYSGSGRSSASRISASTVGFMTPLCT